MMYLIDKPWTAAFPDNGDQKIGRWAQQDRRGAQRLWLQHRRGDEQRWRQHRTQDEPPPLLIPSPMLQPQLLSPIPILLSPSPILLIGGGISSVGPGMQAPGLSRLQATAMP